MATLEKPKQKKNKHNVPSKSKTKQSTTECRQEFDDAAKVVDKTNEIPIETEASSSKSTVEESILPEQILEETKEETENDDVCAEITSQEKEFDETNNAQENVMPLEEAEAKFDTTCDTTSDVDDKVLIPSAPTEHKTITTEIIRYPELPVREISQTIQNTEPINCNPKELIRPFTITQLSALYNNPELVASKQFISQFVDSELRAVNSNKHPLHDLLMNYRHSREKLQENSVELNNLKSAYTVCQNQLWETQIEKLYGKAQCQDATNVTATHMYEQAVFQRNKYEDLVKLQYKIKVQANEVYALHAYTTCLLKLKIEHYINTVIQSCQTALGLSNVRNDHPVTLKSPTSTSQLQELRLCISVLFQCQRRVYKDREFVLETRAWLTDLVALLLRASDWQDHHYVLNQVLRCPAGIGSWATNYIQLPVPSRGEDLPFSNIYVNHILAILSVLLCPVEKRDAFLEQIIISLQEPQDAVAENLWVLVDSDGEEDEDTCGVSALKENDLVALLNQIPMADLFRSVLLIQRQDERDIWTGLEDSHHILRLLSFCTVLTQLYGQGLEVYNTTRYHQFAKRLCRLVRQTLQYASDSWEVYREKKDAQYDKAMFDRLQTEYDAFFLRATSFLYSAQKLGAWQFLAIAPFHTVSINTLWRFYYMLQQGTTEQIDDFSVNLDFKNLLLEQNSRLQFCERLYVMSTEESYYLLNTFANMIMARPETDEDFIRFGTINLLQIGFSGDSEAQESCCKCAGILLSNITSRYPALITDILSYVKMNINDLKQIMFLFSELPLNLWHPTDRDMDIISSLLLQNPITSMENYTARKILSNLNWGFAGNGVLFLPLEIHQRVAELCIVTADKDAQQEHAYRWAWNLSFRLRLHATSRNTTSVNLIPISDTLQELHKATLKEQPLAMFISLVMTDIGHLLPLVCSKGLTCLLNLTVLGKYDAVFVALYNIIPLFVECSDNLLMCVYFPEIIKILLQADRTYMKMAKNIISAEYPGPTLRNFETMINLQIHNPMWHPLFEFWTKTFISLPNWENDHNVLYLLNVIVRTAFFIPEKYRQIGDIFKEMLENVTEKKSATNSTLLSWVAQFGSNPAGSALILGPGIGGSQPWLFYLITCFEHHHIEITTGLWPELLRQLHSSTGKTNVDAALKKAANVVRVASYTSAGLCVYRWAQQALDTELNHPLLPLIWQRFFSLYLARVPTSPGRSENCGSVGSKFFDGMVNTSFCKKLKKRLQETVEFHHRKLDPSQNEAGSESTNDATQRNKELTQRLVKIFNAYVLWLEEPLLQESSLYLPSLPPQYEPRYLQHIIQGSNSPWLELVNCDVIRNDFERCRTEWDTLCCNTKPVQRAPIQKMGGGEVKDPVERILRRLTSYDKPLPPPPLNKKAFVIPALNLKTGESVSSTLQPYIKKLQQFAEIYSLQISEHGALDCQYIELSQQLYSSIQTSVTKKVTCNSSCAGPAVVSFTFSESKLNENIKHQMQTNRTNFATLLSRSLQPPVHSMCLNCASLEYTAEVLQRYLQDSLRLSDSISEEQFRNMGAEFFYFMLQAFNEELKSYPPTLQLFNTVLEKLGQGFLSGIEKESVRLVRTILQQPKKGSLLSPHFVATNFSTHILLQLYTDICDNVDNFPEITFALLSKFNIEIWLTSKRPKLAERSKFINLVFQSLTKLGPNPTKQQFALHEVFRRHLLTVFRHDFPEHYGEVLMLALQNSASQTLAITVWNDLLSSLSQPGIHNDAQFMRNHATKQRLLGARDLADTVDLLSRYFSQERLQFGLYGLYPKYRSYIEPICMLLGMTLHALVVATVEAQEGAILADSLLADHLWPRIVQAFSPWLLPYSVNDCKDVTANWIQQLTDDRAVLLPWIQADIINAKKFFNMFVNCILFIGDTLPGSSHLFSYVWQFYSVNFAHPAIKEHIWTVVHKSLISIKWEQFWPTLADLEMMLKIMEQYLPECHTFLGHVFLEINWPMWVSRLTQGGNSVAIVRAHHCLLHLLVKIFREPSVRQADRARILIERAREFSWIVLDINTLEQTLDWYVMSCDPRVALPLDAAVKQIDYIVFGLLRVVACYDNTIQPINVTIVKKRQCFIRAYIKLVITCSSRNKQLLSDKPEQFCVALTNQLDHMELVISSGTDSINQSTLLVSEFLQVFNNTLLCPVALKCMEQWLETRTAASEVLKAILKTTCNVISSAESASTILEAAFSAYFTPSMSDNSIATWPNAVELLCIGPPRQPTLEQALVSSGRLLTLYAFLLKKVSSCEARKDIESVLDMLVQWLSLVKVNDTVESKLPLLWSQVIQLALRICHENNEEKAAVCLRKFVNGHLILVADNKNTNNTGGWGRGLLGAIGLTKQNSTTQQSRFLCRALAGFILAQLPESKGESQKVRCFAGASNPVGQPGGNVECAKVLLKLNTTTVELKPHLEQTLKQIQDPQNSLHNAEQFLFGLVDILFSKAYLKIH